MELIPRYSTRINKQQSEYSTITGKRITTKLWIEKLLELGDEEIEKQRSLLHTGMMLVKK